MFICATVMVKSHWRTPERSRHYSQCQVLWQLVVGSGSICPGGQQRGSRDRHMLGPDEDGQGQAEISSGTGMKLVCCFPPARV